MARTEQAIEVTSAAFEHEDDVPVVHTCDGKDVSPPLEWSAGPEGTQAYALVMEDPDAPGGTFVHWVAWNVDGTSLPEAVPVEHEGPGAMRQGTSSFGRTGYGGPCPPSGTHRYYFRVYALDRTLDLPETTDADALREAMRGHVLAQGVLLGRYAR